MAVNFETLVNEALQLSLEDQARLVTRIVTAMSRQHDESPFEDIEPLTDEEITEMLRPEPMPRAEIVAPGLTGGWADLGITDGAEWVQEQRFSRSGLFSHGAKAAVLNLAGVNQHELTTRAIYRGFQVDGLLSLLLRS